MTTKLVLYSGLAGITVFIGAILAYLFNQHVKESEIKYEISHMLMSFGSGVILSALCLILVPEGMEQLDLLPFVVSFLLGSMLFMLADAYLAKRKGKTAPLIAMLLDFIPESIVLGAMFTLKPSLCPLLAFFIGLQNLPESFNAYKGFVNNGQSIKKTLILFFCLSFFGIAAALFGYYFLSTVPSITAYLMTFASGGILYLLVQDLIPESKLNKNYLTSLGASFGFLVGVVAKAMV